MLWCSLRVVLIQEADPREVWSLGKMAFITFRGLLPRRGKNLLNARAKWRVYATAWRMYTPNVECKTRKKNMIFLKLFSVLFSLESTVNWLKSKKVQRNVLTAKFMVCGLVKDVFRNDQHKLHFTCSLLLNIQHYFFIVFNSSFCAHWLTSFPL